MLSAAAVLALLMTASCSPPTTTDGDAAVQTPAPVVPEWTAQYMGQNIAEVFITSMSRDGCIGYVDGATAHPGGGQQVVGWAWSSVNRRAYDRLVATDANGVIVGGGGTDTERPDVTAANASVSTPLVGFTVTAQGPGPISVFGIDETASTRCPVGASQ